MLTFNAQFTRRLFTTSMVMLICWLVLALDNVAAVISPPLSVNTSISSTVGFEGFLAQANGAPIANGAYTLTFRVYDVPTAGTPLWAEQQIGIQVTNGLYSVVLGATTPFTTDTFSGNRWIGVTVGNGTEIAPRTQISAVPFALNAVNANKIGGGGTANMVALFDGPCPEGWTEYTAAQGRVVVGMPANGTLGGTVGTALIDKEDRTHTHTTPKHSHNLAAGEETVHRLQTQSKVFMYANGYGGYMFGSLQSGNPYVPYNSFTELKYYTEMSGGDLDTGTASTSSVIPYIQLRYCKLNS